MRYGMVCLGLLLLACSSGERDDASTIFGSTFSGSFTADGADMSTEESASAADEDTTTASTTEPGDGDPTGDGDPGDGDPGDGDPGDGDPGDGDPGDGDPGDGDPTDSGDPLCGNGQIDQGEECDGQNLGGQSCSDHGFDGGVLACDPTICIYDTSGCMDDMPPNQCNQFCNGCTCPSFECSMCCALKDQVDVCNGGMCGCF